jgi:hypothetical protein
VFFGRILNAMLAVTKEGSNTIKRNTFELNLNGIGIIHLPLLFSLLHTFVGALGCDDHFVGVVGCSVSCGGHLHGNIYVCLFVWLFGFTFGGHMYDNVLIFLSIF